MDENQALESRQDMQHFTATGRPYRSPQPTKEGWSMNSMSGTESFGAGPANLLPVKFTDDSLITIPVLRPEDKGKAIPSKTRKSWFSFGRKAKEEFVMKQVTRGEYLKHYAKDDSSIYIGTDEPAVDCILRGKDAAEYRGGLTFRHDISEMESKQQKPAELVR